MTALPVISVSPEQAAEMTSLSAQTIRRLCQAGHLRHRKVGTRYAITVRALQEFMEADQSSSESNAAAPRRGAEPGAPVVVHDRASDADEGGVPTAPPSSPSLVGAATPAGR